MEVTTQTKKSRFNKRFYYLLISLLVSLSGFSQNVGINSTGSQPNASAGLDVDFSNKGLLIPRVALTSTTSFAPLSAHVAGMVVYNTATVSDVTPGFYYNNGTKWTPGFIKGQSIGDMLYWSGTDWLRIPIGVTGQYLQISGSNIPTWGGNIFATLSTTSASSIAANTAASGGNIISDGGSAVLSRGICWNTVGAPTIASTKTTDASGIGIFTSSMTGLIAGTTYHVRAYAMNSYVINYGNEITFTTLASAPVINPTNSTAAATSITGTSAVTGGNFATDGGSPITQRGVCYATTSAPTIANSKVIDPSLGVGSFVSNLTGLAGGTVYYVRSYATNSVGTTYGTQISFTTLVTQPTLVTVAASSIAGSTATSGASMSWTGGGYSNYQNYGVAYSTVSNSATPTFVATNTNNGPVNIATPIAPWTTNLTGLVANTTYYIRAYLNLYASATGWVTIFGNELSFTTTGATAPIIASTSAITNLSANTANTGGTITSDGGSPITAKGVCWSISPSPTLGVSNFTTNGTGTATFSSSVTGLTGSTTYYVRAYATNSVGTTYGPTDVTFTTWVQAPYALGQNLGWAYCAYVAPDGSGYLVSPDITPTSPATTFTWGCTNTHVAVGTALGTGKTNTDLIIASCGANTAAGEARAYTGGGYNDWFLPSSSEFQLVATNYTLFGFSGGYTSYFTSSEAGTNYAYANSYFYTGSQAYSSSSPRIGDSYTHAIRAMRSFSGISTPTVATDVVVNISSTGATSGGTIGTDGGAAVTARGVCWNTATAPTIANSKTTDGTGIGSYSSSITGLTSGTKYYVRAYATNSAGTNYGNEVSFTAIAPVKPTLTTDAITSLAATTATSGGNITADGGALLTAYGVCWNTVTAPTITTNAGITNDFAVTGPIPLAFVSGVTGLTPGTTYHLRAYATTSAGTSYGNEEVFTPSNLPVVSTDPMGSLVGGIAEGNYTVTSEGAGGMTDVGLCWGTSVDPTITTNSGIIRDPYYDYLTGFSVSYSFPLDMTGLTVGTLYHVRAYATNASGTAYGADITFTATAATLGQYAILNYQGGYVFDVDVTGTHGLLGLAYSPGSTVDWGCTSSVTGATGTVLGTGLANSTAILGDITTNGCISAAPAGAFAPQLCQWYDTPNWYLPSKDELNLLWTNRNADATGALDAALSAAIGLAPIWSSSEVDATHAWSLDGAAAMVNTGLKTDQNNVWPIRSF